LEAAYMMDKLIDFFLNSQEFLIPFAVLVVIGPLLIILFFTRLSSAPSFNIGPVGLIASFIKYIRGKGNYYEDYKNKVVYNETLMNYRKINEFAPKNKSILIPVILFILLSTTVGIVKPIPSTVALDLPPAERDLATNRKLLIFMHGWNGDPAHTWNRFPQLVQADKKFADFNILLINYPTFFARRNLGITEMAHWINEKLNREGIYARHDEIWIVAHSMGGLIARELLVANRIQQSNNKFHLLIEIATPHKGASTASLSRSLGVSRGFTDDLSPGSRYLTILRENWNYLQDRPRTFCLSSPHDSIVDVDSAIAFCDNYLLYPQWDHTEMVKPDGNTDDRYLTPLSKILN
jgi:hypothetical protein